MTILGLKLYIKAYHENILNSSTDKQELLC